jgi:hypothetical protein
MAKLNQIIAVVNGKKSKTLSAITGIYHVLQKPPLFDGLSRNYRPLDDDGETFPDERKNIQFHVPSLLINARKALAELFDVTATQEYANTSAKADVIVDGKTLASGVPITYLLFLEKQLTDFHSLVSKLPTLDPVEKWYWDENASCYSSEPTQTNKTKKIPRTHLLHPPTIEHPAQCEMYHEDIKVGEWTTVKRSGAIPTDEKNDMLERVDKLREAVKFAREEANSGEAETQKIAKPLFDYLLGDISTGSV